MLLYLILDMFVGIASRFTMYIVGVLVFVFVILLVYCCFSLLFVLVML